jgi:hypothetical protein
MLFYGRQGFKIVYPYPFLGTLFKHIYDQFKRADVFLYTKEMATNNPEMKNGYTNVIFKDAAVIFTDPVLIGEFLNKWENYKKLEFGMDIF